MINFLFVLAGTITGFFAGIGYGVLTVPKSSGLAGPAIVLGDGMVGAIVLLLLSLWVRGRLNYGMRKKITIVLFLVCLIPLGWMFYQFKNNRSGVDALPPEKPRPVTPVAFAIESSEGPMGLGLAKPDFYTDKVLYFYSPNLEKSPDDHAPVDSLLFGQTDHHQFDISYAPPWFYPEISKMDYELLYLKVLNRTHDWIQVEVNKQTGQSTWIDVSAVKMIYWPDFLLSVNSIENNYAAINPLRGKPLINASTWVGNPYEYMLPISINENWIRVSLRDKNMKEVGTAWLRWHDGNSLLITYNLLS